MGFYKREYGILKSFQTWQCHVNAVHTRWQLLCINCHACMRIHTDLHGLQGSLLVQLCTTHELQVCTHVCG
jgi:hypothetical protein